jgi:uncharacterized repeat protein (TIGR03917 family)
MGIFSSDVPGHWRTPATGRVLVHVTTLPADLWEMVINPGADVQDIAAGLAIIPVGAVFVEHFSDVEAVLTFRENPAGPPAPEGVPLVPANPLVPAGAAAH